jgi:hypothetical protein
MIESIKKPLSEAVIESIELQKIIYAEVTPPGAMGNAGGIIIYILQSETNEIICYESNIYDDEGTYLAAEKLLLQYHDTENINQENENLYFNYYYAGGGNHVFINKKANLSILNNHFIYNTSTFQFQISSSCRGVFNSLIEQLKLIDMAKTAFTKRISPEWINTLEDDEIFVFGSNLEGFHGGGAAATARKWGAIWGQGVGLQGKTYAIPTMHGGVETIKPYVDDFLSFAKSNTDLKFLVTEIGCGIAGFKAEEIAPLFKSAIEENIENIYLPLSFCNLLINDMPSN